MCTYRHKSECVQVRKSMCRIKYVLFERARAESDPIRSVALKQFVKGL